MAIFSQTGLLAIVHRLLDNVVYLLSERYMLWIHPLNSAVKPRNQTKFLAQSVDAKHTTKE